jgi:hypothetical protein
LRTAVPSPTIGPCGVVAIRRRTSLKAFARHEAQRRVEAERRERRRRLLRRLIPFAR